MPKRLSIIILNISLLVTISLANLTPTLNAKLGIKGIKYKNLTLNQKITKGLANTTLKSGLKEAVYGGKYINNLREAAAGEFQADFSHTIAKNYQSGDINYFEHKLSHALLGATSSAIAKRDITAGVIGALSGEVIGEDIKDTLSKDGYFSPSDKIYTRLYANLAATIISGLSGHDMQSAYDSSKSAVDNNTLYLYKNRVVATDKIDNKKIVKLSSKELAKLSQKLDATHKKRVINTPLVEAYLNGKIEDIPKQDTTKFKSVFNLDNKKEFETLRAKTDMKYYDINKNTKIVFWNGMNNTREDAKQSQALISKDFSNIGLFSNKTHNLLGDFLEWKPNYLTIQDVLNGYMLRQLPKGTILITHSAGNEDSYKGYKVLQLENVKLKDISQISVGSPRSLTDLKKEGAKVGVKNIVQINNPHDPIANGWVNGDGDYEVKYGLKDLEKFKIPIYNNLKKNHPFESYYPKVKKEIILQNTIKTSKRLKK